LAQALRTIASELIEFCAGFPAVDQFGAKIPAFDNRLRVSRDKQGGGGIQENRIPFGTAIFAGQQRVNDPGVLEAIATAQMVER